MSECDYMCTECDGNPKMAVPKEMRTDYGMMVTANILMAVSIDSLARKNDELQAENAKLREAVATAIKVQAVLCGDADSPYCHKECPLHRQESDDCLACDVIGVAQELGIEVDL